MLLRVEIQFASKSSVKDSLVACLSIWRFAVHWLAKEIQLVHKSTAEALQLRLSRYVIWFCSARVCSGWAKWLTGEYEVDTFCAFSSLHLVVQ